MVLIVRLIVDLSGRPSRQLCPDGLVFHPEKGEGEDPCDNIHGVPDRCEGREERQRAKPGESISHY